MNSENQTQKRKVFESHLTGIDAEYDFEGAFAHKDDTIHLSKKPNRGVRTQFLTILIALQLISFIFFASSTTYSDSKTLDGMGTVSAYYSFYQDVHVMIFIGFGLLMTFLKKHGFNSMGMTFLIGVMSIQIGIMWLNFFHHGMQGKDLTLHLDLPTLIAGDFAAGAVLISYGALLGRLNATQILLMVFFELFFYAMNEYIGLELLEVVDMGGSMFVHTFGAYFGLAFSYMWGNPEEKETENEGSVYHSDIFAMIGSVFLWMYWPSFNGALAPEETHQKERVIINTVLSLCCSCAWTFAISHALEHGKFEMVHIQNATLAGGVAIGSASDLAVGPWAACLLGTIAGIVSTIGYVKLTPLLNSFGIYDVCGINNLHGMPGIIGGIGGAFAAATASSEQYGDYIDLIYGARENDDRSAVSQGGYQFFALLITLFISISSGLICSWIIKNITSDDISLFSDEDQWNVPTKEPIGSYFETVTPNSFQFFQRTDTFGSDTTAQDTEDHQSKDNLAE